MAEQESWTQLVDDIFITTWANRRKQATIQAFEKTPLIWWLREKGQIQNLSGGTRIEIPLEYGSNSTLRWISKGSVVPLIDDQILSMAYDEWRNVAVSVVRWMADDQKNKGKEKLINLIDSKLGAAERTLWEEFERVMFADGSDANTPNGLLNIVADDPTTGVLHGIDRAKHDWFRNQSMPSSGAFSAYGKLDMSHMLNNVSRYAGADVKDVVMVTSQEVFEMYENEVMEIKQLQNTMFGDAGFDNLQFRGRPIIWCPSAPVDKMYFLVGSYLKLVCDNDYWMEMTDWKEFPNQAFDKACQIVCSMNLICDRPVTQGVITNITA